jgi:predicted RNase H-like HicB family nuclease
MSGCDRRVIEEAIAICPRPRKLLKSLTMERLFHLHIERLPEGVFLATSDEIQGLVAQGRTINETIEIARDVARKLIQANAIE